MQPPQYPYRQPGPAPKPPGRVQRFMSWYREQSPRTRLVVGIAILACALFVCAAAISGVVSGVTQSVLPTPIVASHPTQQAPTATPTPRTSPTKAHVQTILALDQADTPTIVTYDQKSGKLVVATVIGSRVGVGTQIIEQTLQDIQVDIWKSGDYFTSVTVNYMQHQDTGPDQKLAYAVLTYKTAQSLDMNLPLDWWSHYDQKFIDPSVPNF